MVFLGDQTSTLGQAMCTAGRLGSQALPEVANATLNGKDGAKFTVIDNVGAIQLAEWKEQ